MDNSDAMQYLYQLQRLTLKHLKLTLDQAESLLYYRMPLEVHAKEKLQTVLSLVMAYMIHYADAVDLRQVALRDLWDRLYGYVTVPQLRMLREAMDIDLMTFLERMERDPGANRVSKDVIAMSITALLVEREAIRVMLEASKHEVVEDGDDPIGQRAVRTLHSVVGEGKMVFLAGSHDWASHVASVCRGPWSTH